MGIARRLGPLGDTAWRSVAIIVKEETAERLKPSSSCSVCLERLWDPSGAGSGRRAATNPPRRGEGIREPVAFADESEALRTGIWW